jgi:hypothetical protein
LTDRGNGDIYCSPDYRTFDYTPFLPAFDDNDDTLLSWFYSTDGSTWIEYEGADLSEDMEQTGGDGPGKQWALFWEDLEHPELKTRLSNVITLQ